MDPLGLFIFYIYTLIPRSLSLLLATLLCRFRGNAKATLNLFRPAVSNMLVSLRGRELLIQRGVNRLRRVLSDS